MKRHVKLFEEFNAEEFLSDFGVSVFDIPTLHTAINSYAWRDPYYKNLLNKTKFKKIEIVPGSNLYNNLNHGVIHARFTKSRPIRTSDYGVRRAKALQKMGKPHVYHGKTIVKWDLTYLLKYLNKRLEYFQNDPENKKRTVFKEASSRAFKRLKSDIFALSEAIKVSRYITVTWKFLFLNYDDPDAFEENIPEHKGAYLLILAEGSHPLQKKPFFKTRGTYFADDYYKTYDEALLSVLDSFDYTEAMHKDEARFFNTIRYTKNDEYDNGRYAIWAYMRRKTKKS